MSEFRRNLLKIGGGKINPNLLTGTRDFSGFSNTDVWSLTTDYQGCKRMGKDYPWGGLSKGIVVEAGKWYTFSLTATAPEGMKLYVFLGDNGNDTTGLSPCFKAITWEHAAGTPHRVELTFYCSARRRIIPRLESGSNGWITVCQYKLEKGKKATPWCPNIND